MRYRLALIVMVAVACLLAGEPQVSAQSCPASSASNDAQRSGPEISIVEVTFSGALQLATSDQEQIAASIRQETHGEPLDGVVEEAFERVRAGWQDRGYFKVLVDGEARTVTSGPVSQRIALSVRIDEGLQYSLDKITFKNNKAITDVDALRDLFPVKDGDIFSRKKIASGLGNLRKAYGMAGYINFVAVPDTRADDDKKLIDLEIDLDEGKRFYVSGVDIFGLEEPAREELLNDFHMAPGQVYNSAIYELFLRKHASVLPPCGCAYRRTIDEKAGTIALTFDFRPCGT